MNSAFVFIKPHANTAGTRDLVSQKFAEVGITVKSEGELTGEQIDEQKLIDQHYYAIASKATILKPHQLPVPAAKFEETFGLSWEDALAQGVVFNAMDGCAYLGLDAFQLEKEWRKCTKLVKFGGGFYCGLVDTVEGKDPAYIFNAFFMSMRAAFVQPGTSIHFYEVEFNPEELKWEDFRGKVLGPTNPANAPADSLRGLIMANWESLGLEAQPDTGNNGVHASASPVEGLAERMNWLKADLEQDSFGAKLLSSGVITKQHISDWSVDPQVSGVGSLFDAVEDMDCSDCYDKLVEIAKL
jgi:hypothetical protein